MLFSPKDGYIYDVVWGIKMIALCVLCIKKIFRTYIMGCISALKDGLRIRKVNEEMCSGSQVQDQVKHLLDYSCGSSLGNRTIHGGLVA